MPTQRSAPPPVYGLRAEFKTIDRLLAKQYDTPVREPEEPLDSLIATILSQNTNDTNSARTYDAMRAAFPTWRDVMNASPKRLAEALKPGGLANVKSRRIIRILKSIARRGDLNLDYLEQLSTSDAEKALLAFEGVGLKTARCVLLFALGRDVFPVNTHIERILKRLGIVEPRLSPEAAHRFAGPLIPKGRCYPMHINLIRHGRWICHPRHPRCRDCVLNGLCAYYSENHGEPK